MRVNQWLLELKTLPFLTFIFEAFFLLNEQMKCSPWISIRFQQIHEPLKLTCEKTPHMNVIERCFVKDRNEGNKSQPVFQGWQTDALSRGRLAGLQLTFKVNRDWILDKNMHEQFVDAFKVAAVLRSHTRTDSWTKQWSAESFYAEMMLSYKKKEGLF